MGSTRANLLAVRAEKGELEAALVAAEARAKELERAVRDNGQRASAAALAAANTDAGRAMLEKRAESASLKANAALSESVKLSLVKHFNLPHFFLTVSRAPLLCAIASLLHSCLSRKVRN